MTPKMTLRASLLIQLFECASAWSTQGPFTCDFLSLEHFPFPQPGDLGKSSWSMSQLFHKSSQNFQDAHCPLNQCYLTPYFFRVRGGQAQPRLVPHPLALSCSCSPRNPGRRPCHSSVLKHSPPPHIDPVSTSRIQFSLSTLPHSHSFR